MDKNKLDKAKELEYEIESMKSFIHTLRTSYYTKLRKRTNSVFYTLVQNAFREEASRSVRLPKDTILKLETVLNEYLHELENQLKEL